MKKAVLVLVCACVVWGFVGEAMAYPAIDLLNDCQQYLAGGSSVQSAMCIGYVAGFLETVEIWPETLRNYYCLPQESEFEQLVRVIIKYQENHPEKLHLKATGTILLAFKEAFPCPEAE